MATSHGSFSSSYLRRNYFKQHFRYIEPNEIIFGHDNLNNKHSGYYVSIKKTLETLLEYNTHALAQIKSIPNVLEDIFDGAVYQKN